MRSRLVADIPRTYAVILDGQEVRSLTSAEGMHAVTLSRK